MTSHAEARTEVPCSRPPRPLTPLVGRRAELAELRSLLTNPTCRLLTLVGPGGIGKTRLAIEAAADLCPHFEDGIGFVPLQSVQSIDLVVPAIADSLDLILSDPDDPGSGLGHYLHDKAMLLVLDNIEHLLGSDPDALARLLEAAPTLKLLVTSREVLNLQQEWLYPVAGLAIPPSEEETERWTDYDAVKLLIERARRVRRDFRPERDAAGVVRLCRLVEGMPLALELAATWTRTLACSEVADEIRRSLEILRADLRDVPERHRSIEAVFEQTWQRLLPEEQDVLLRLAVFREGFRRAAATAVAGASLPVLTALVDKSLLRWEPDHRRYQIHELLRQYVEGRHAFDSESLDRARDTHARYYVDFLGDRFDRLGELRKCKVLDEIEEEIEDVRTAWRWTISQGRVAELERATYVFATFCISRSRIVEGERTFSLALDALPDPSPSPRADGDEPVRAALLSCRGWLYLHLGQAERAEHDFDLACALYRSGELTGVPGPGTDPLSGLAVAARLRGDYARAIALAGDVRTRAEEQGDRLGIATAAFVLASVYIDKGRHHEALPHAREALGEARSADHPLLLSFAHDRAGQIAQALGDLSSAKRHYEASHAIRDAFRYPRGIALSLQLLADVAELEGDNARARTLYRQGLDTFRKITDRAGMVQCLCGLGNATHGLDRIADAREYFRQALEAAARSPLVPEILSVLVKVGTFLLRSGVRDRGAEALAFVAEYPAVDVDLRAQVRRFLETDRTGEPDEFAAKCAAEGEALELDRLIGMLLAELSLPVTSDPDTPPSLAPVPGLTDHALADPLTERELQVLQLIGTGLSNQQIAERLFVVVGTVKKHTNNIYGKLGVRRRTQAVARARELELLP